VRGAIGHKPTDRYKVCVTYDDGWRGVIAFPIRGPDARPSASVWRRRC